MRGQGCHAVIMAQSHPVRELLLAPRQAQDIAQRPDLELVEVLVHGILHQRLELEHAFFNFERGVGVCLVAVGVDVWSALLGGIAVFKSEKMGRGAGNACFKGICAAVEDFVDCVDDVVDQGLRRRLVRVGG